MTAEPWPFWTQLSSDPAQSASAWLRAIRAACARVARGQSWNPSIYGHPLDWSDGDRSTAVLQVHFDNLPTIWTDELREDLVQDVYMCLHTNRLIGETFEKIVHTLEACEDLSPNAQAQNLLQKILKSCVERVLIRRANKNDLLRLKKRFRTTLEENFVLTGHLPPHAFAVTDTSAYGRTESDRLDPLTNDDLVRGRNVLACYPPEVTVVSDGERQRAPRYYSGDQLVTVVGALIDEINKAISGEFLDRVVEHVFEYLKRPIPLSQDSVQLELASVDSTDRDNSSQVDVLASQSATPKIVEEFMSSLSPREQVILAAHFGRWGAKTSQQIAGALIPSVTRQTVEQTRDRISNKFRDFVAKKHDYLVVPHENLEGLKSALRVELRRASLHVDAAGILDEQALQ